MGHTDNDFLDNDFHTSCMPMLIYMKEEMNITNHFHLKIEYNHVHRRFLDKNKFATVTTCGYKTFYDSSPSENTSKKLYMLISHINQ